MKTNPMIYQRSKIYGTVRLVDIVDYKKGNWRPQENDIVDFEKCNSN